MNSSNSIFDIHRIDWLLFTSCSLLIDTCISEVRICANIHSVELNSYVTCEKRNKTPLARCGNQINKEIDPKTKSPAHKPYKLITQIKMTGAKTH